MTEGAIPHRSAAHRSARGIGAWLGARRSRLGGAWVIWLCLAWVVAMLLISLLVPWLAPFGYAEQSLLLRLKPPASLGGNESYLLGTDNLGRDVFSRVLYAIRTSISIALIGTVIGTTIGTVLGILAAHFRGWIEDLIMALVDFQASMPFIIIALAVLAFLGNSFELFLLLVGLHGWETYARLVRGLALSANAEGYAGAIRTLGIHPVRIYWRHVIPNIAGTLAVQTTLNFPDLILLETSLSFLGLGVQPPQTSLGLMLGEGRNYLATAWWIGVPSGLIIFATTLSVSLLGDWFRDHLDKTLRKRAG
ncbi:ABC transporter permease [Dongia sedimenti]|uniref:ABC transporter permease n=1 Tax=Dongia sedimenti TaxID=3064282 RepID=A0ABU0YNN7_9PROT|nr:ABC transporter permease [Rhodospirillaceae bacterium R-7]